MIICNNLKEIHQKTKNIYILILNSCDGGMLQKTQVLSLENKETCGLLFRRALTSEVLEQSQHFLTLVVGDIF